MQGGSLGKFVQLAEQYVPHVESESDSTHGGEADVHGPHGYEFELLNTARRALKKERLTVPEKYGVLTSSSGS